MRALKKFNPLSPDGQMIWWVTRCTKHDLNAMWLCKNMVLLEVISIAGPFVQFQLLAMSFEGHLTVARLSHCGTRMSQGLTASLHITSWILSFPLLCPFYELDWNCPYLFSARHFDKFAMTVVCPFFAFCACIVSKHWLYPKRVSSENFDPFHLRNELDSVLFLATIFSETCLNYSYLSSSRHF